MGYVCAFRGRRDGYEVPLALAETGRLTRFITDYYQSGPLSLASGLLPARWREKLARRSKDGIPPRKVECLLASTALENILIRLGRPAAATWMEFDARYSRAAARLARRERSDLFLYSPYAMPAFRERFDHSPRKVLFQFHPHANLERAILEEDRNRWRSEGLEFSEDLTSNKAPPGEPEYDRGWSYADHIVCASSFTKRSLREVGADPSRISVIPYGVEMPAAASPGPSHSGFRVLFVGTGMQRKGLHHLLAAWKRAGLDRGGGQLTVVARAIEPSLKAMAAGTQGVVVRPGVMEGELARLYGESDLFCMPSMVEGFGQVYLEALSHGLPVLGTPNTCLPDLGGEADGVHVVEPGDIEALVATLGRLSRTLPGNLAAREAARDCASRFTWPGFRRKIAELLDALDARARETATKGTVR
jgi:glycosyltransferase involved in cell wall biosynthesis